MPTINVGIPISFAASGQNPEGSVATDDDSSTTAGTTKKAASFKRLLQYHHNPNNPVNRSSKLSATHRRN